MVKTTAAAAAPEASSSGVVEETRASELKYKGVRKRKWGKYVCEIRLPNSRDRIWLGSYDTAEKAARAFDAALFCLRGPTANFNFPEDPPHIPGGQALTPPEIQAVAQHYAAKSSAGDQPQINPPTASAVELEDASPSPSSEGAAPMDDSIDWSFLDMLDTNAAGGGGGGNAGHVSDFGIFPDPGDMYMPLHLSDDKDADKDDDVHGNGGNMPSFLWSFTE